MAALLLLKNELIIILKAIKVTNKRETKKTENFRLLILFKLNYIKGIVAK